MITFLPSSRNVAYIFTPPTLKREVQFRDVLRETLLKSKVSFREIMCEKLQDIERTLRPQKELKGMDKIINARESIQLDFPKDGINEFSQIIIFDDNFTTGATMNAIAEKVRYQGFTGKITALTITGNFEYMPGVTDEGEV